MQRLTVPALLACLFAVMLWAAGTGVLNIYWQSVLMFMGVNIILATSLNIINGNMGEFSCGHAGFMAWGLTPPRWRACSCSCRTRCSASPGCP